MDVQGFLERHPVFTTAEFASYLDTHRPGATKTVDSLLRYYTRRGRLIRIRRGLYAVVPRGFDPGAYHIDPYLIAAKMADDAVLAYHTPFNSMVEHTQRAVVSSISQGAPAADTRFEGKNSVLSDSPRAFLERGRRSSQFKNTHAALCSFVLQA